MTDSDALPAEPQDPTDVPRPGRALERQAARRASQLAPLRDLTPADQSAFCDHLARTGDFGTAAELIGSTQRFVRQAIRNDPDFADFVEEAWRDYRDGVLIPAATRRAVEGVFEPSYYRGAPSRDHDNKDPEACRKGTCTCPIGGKRNYSDQVLLRLLEVLDPRFRPHKVTEHKKAAFDPRDLDQLSPDAKAKLEQFLLQVELDQARAAHPGAPQPPPPTPEIQP